MCERAVYILPILLLCSITTVYANQPYIGGYLRSSVVTTSRVHLAVSLSGAIGENFSSASWLGGVVSVAGANSTTLTGWTYQNMVTLKKNMSVLWAPQAWLGGGRPQWYYEKIVGDELWVAYHLRIDIVNHNVTFKCFAYHYTWQYGQNDSPIIYSWSNITADNNFLIGRQIISNYAFKHFQFGVESNQPITNQSWSLINKKPCYYNGSSWLYTPANVTWGNTSLITIYGNNGYGVGGDLYQGVNQDFISNDFVEWKFTNSTITDDSQLWGSSGTVTDVVTKPYQ